MRASSSLNTSVAAARVSQERLGGWERREPVSAVTSICAHAIRDPASKKYLIFHTGCGNDTDPRSHAYGLNTCVPAPASPARASALCPLPTPHTPMALRPATLRALRAAVDAAAATPLRAKRSPAMCASSTEITNCNNGSTPACSGNWSLNKCKYAPLPPRPSPRPPGPPPKYVGPRY